MKSLSTSNQVAETTPEEERLLASLRAQEWKEYIGQDQIKSAVHIAIEAARQRDEAMDHTLFYGPPGLGKTTLAHLIAKEMGTDILVTSGTALSKVADIAAILTNLKKGDILFIDEIHRLPKAVEETLYPAMEDFALDIVIGKGPSAKTIRLDLQPFTLVGATTRMGMMAGPFRDRFGLVHRLEYYDVPTLEKIVLQAGNILHIEVPNDCAIEIAQRARGTPRIALKLLKRVRDYIQVRSDNRFARDTVHEALELLHIDPLGLDDTDRRILHAIVETFGGGPVGIGTLASATHEDAGTIEEVIEPYLMQLGLIKRTPQGRVATEKGKEI